MKPNPALSTDDVSAARKILSEVISKDEEFRRLVGKRPLRMLAYGNSSVAFFVTGSDNIVKFTINEIDCRYASRLYKKGKVAGWPEVRSFVRVRFKDSDTACAMVVEKCKEYLVLPSRQKKRLRAAVAVVEVWFGYEGRRRLSDLEDWDDLDEEQQRWAEHLVDGLRTIRRIEDEPDVDLDTYEGNFGLDLSGNAVWLDYGV